ncbi:hypothetical protein AaE_012851 [Aphanomyces astaci]|uniref:Uncharacterized protein n=1 Tax=Aphanomyces astaci TaxID=112090 RepID=A0A6A4ZPK1_APHAT|nr:hypothetical protein AaE_012851 [Aphanomyces astaci]
MSALLFVPSPTTSPLNDGNEVTIKAPLEGPSMHDSVSNDPVPRRNGAMANMQTVVLCVVASTVVVVAIVTGMQALRRQIRRPSHFETQANVDATSVSSM